MIPPLAKNISEVFERAPDAARKTLLEIRTLIFQTAASNPAIGPLTETLKWGEPAYLTEQTKSGSTLRIAWHAKKPNYIGLYLNCKTTLVDRMREVYPDHFEYEGSRAVILGLGKPLPKDALSHLIEMALTYHSNKKRRLE